MKILCYRGFYFCAVLNTGVRFPRSLSHAQWLSRPSLELPLVGGVQNELLPHFHAMPVGSRCLSHFGLANLASYPREAGDPGPRLPLTPNKLEISFAALVNPSPDEHGANSSSAAARHGAACGIPDNSCVLRPSNACRRGPRDCPSCDNHGGRGHRLGPGRWPLELWLQPRLGWCNNGGGQEQCPDTPINTSHAVLLFTRDAGIQNPG
jgi:hypothetical protein